MVAKAAFWWKKDKKNSICYFIGDDNPVSIHQLPKEISVGTESEATKAIMEFFRVIEAQKPTGEIEFRIVKGRSKFKPDP